jgi:hypothetical protein
MSELRDPRFAALDRAIALDAEPLRFRRVTFYDGAVVVKRDHFHSGARVAAPEKAMIAHSTFESFQAAVAPPMLRCAYCRGFADAPDHALGCPRFAPVSAAEARRGLRAAYAAGGSNSTREARRAGEQLRDRAQRKETRAALTLPRDRRHADDPVLATDAEIRACTRTGSEQ